MATLEQLIREASQSNVRIHIWATGGGMFQANVAEVGSNAWTCHTCNDPVDALATVLRQRFARVPDREIEVFDEFGEVPPPPEGNNAAQIDIDDVLAQEDPGCVICENAGCDACRPAEIDDFDGLL